jgi:hypothetical protein
MLKDFEGDFVSFENTNVPPVLETPSKQATSAVINLLIPPPTRRSHSSSEIEILFCRSCRRCLWRLLTPGAADVLTYLK